MKEYHYWWIHELIIFHSVFSQKRWHLRDEEYQIYELTDHNLDEYYQSSNLLFLGNNQTSGLRLQLTIKRTLIKYVLTL